MNNLRFENLSIASVRGRYDLFVCALGYEARAISCCSKLLEHTGKAIAYGFEHGKEISYRPNLQWFNDNGVAVFDDVSDVIFSDLFLSEVNEALLNRLGNNPLRVSVDISCMNRFRLAALLSIALPQIREGFLELDLWYSLAEFQLPPTHSSQNEVVGPIHPHFAGWFSDPGRPIALVAGLGYEQGKVMGATEYLQASRVVAFIPNSPITDYEPHVASANSSLLAELGERDKVTYSLDDPIRTLATLDAVIGGLSETHNVVVLPLGPKVFTIYALLAHQFNSESSVWRVSSGLKVTPRDVRPSGFYFGLGVRAGDPSESLAPLCT